jgi:hypothetical protein
MRPLLLIAALLPQLAAGAVFTRVFNGISVPTVSLPVRNQGQGMHLIGVFYHGQAAAVTSGVLVRIEASYEGTRWFPITRDVTSTAHVAGAPGYAYAIERGNGVYPYVRVATLQTPADKPLTVWYTGDSEPLGQVMLADGRYVASAPGGGGGGGGGTTVTWALCVGVACSTGTNLTPVWIAPKSGTVTACYAVAQTPPTGASLIIDVSNNGASIFDPAGKLTISSGSSAVAEVATFSAAKTVAAKDTLRISIEQVGSATAGMGVTATCLIE